MYKLEIQTINEDANGEFFNTWLKGNFNNYIGYSFGSPVVVYFSEEPNEEEKEEVLNKYESLTTQDVLLIDNIVYMYTIREVDGKEYYSNFRANLSILFVNGSLSIEHAYYIENKLLKVKGFLLSGDWATAQYEIQNNLVNDGIVSQLDIDHQYTQEMHNEIKENISIYVQENY